ncbi:MAG: GNAT family N-acetyltransferase [Candidatus Promineifilaceae bacterium]|nr:GNAT family N-acetyltransferase [Candidatus Promineifilaceae bacterium]
MKSIWRRFEHENDYWRIRQFLRRVYLGNGRRELSWQTYRFDYWRWHGVANLDQGVLERDLFLWETAAGQVAAVLNPEAPGQVFLQIDPDLCPLEQEDEMLTIAERYLSVETDAGRRQMTVWAATNDRGLVARLRARGYERGRWTELRRRRLLETRLLSPRLAPGYTVRALGDESELPARSWLSWRAFHPDAPDEEYEGWEWYRNIQRAPLYRRDLDLVAVASGGELAAFCTIWFDDVTRTGALEPVGTAPEHRRRGVGKALLVEGLRRLRWLGATLATVGSYEEPAHTLYEAVGFIEYDAAESWTKVW